MMEFVKGGCMQIDAREVKDITLSDEMERSYLDYAMSVIVGRALPDARDGLKPVHRRIMFAMEELGLAWNRPYKKSARIVGDVIGRFHPHGDVAVYDTMVRMAQNFALRYPLVDGQGNYGSLDGDSAAAMRYTEARMSKAAQAMLEDIEKATIDWGPNYDGSEREPLVLPCRFPNLLANGSAGIAVGMATNIPPHNIAELCDAVELLLSKESVSDEELFKAVPAPDFPTGGTLWGQTQYFAAMRSGRGSVAIRAKVEYEEDEEGRRWVVKEVPYQVNKKALHDQIIDLAKSGEVEGLSAVRDESDRHGVRLVLELRRDASAEATLNQLWRKSDMQKPFGINMLALVDGKPKTLSLREALTVFINHRREVVWRRISWELAKAKKDGHIYEGLVVALANIETFLSIIKNAKSPAEAKDALSAKRWKAGEKATEAMASLMGTEAWFGGDFNEEEGYALSETQISEILSMRLQKLTGMEQDSLLEEYADLAKKAASDAKTLASESLIDAIVKRETEECRRSFSDPRRTAIIPVGDALSDEDMMPRQHMLLAISERGYVRCAPLASYSKQHRGGRGRELMDLREGDKARFSIQVWSHDAILFLTNKGRAFSAKPWGLPSDERGKPFDTLFALSEGESLAFALPFSADDVAEAKSLAFLTRKGFVKKTPLAAFAKIRSSGLTAMTVEEEDEARWGTLCSEGEDLLVFSSSGKASRFSEEDARNLSRQARGVRAMRLGAEDEAVAILACAQGDSIVTASKNGFAKKTKIESWRKTRRGSQGLRAMAVSEKTGPLVAVAVLKNDSDEVLALSKGGMVIRVPASQLRETSRSAQGSKLLRLSEDDALAWTARASNDEEAKQMPIDIEETTESEEA